MDNQTVVTHIRALLSGSGDWRSFEHADLWRRISQVLATARASILIHKVASHVSATASLSPLDDFRIEWNSQADAQAGLANHVRPTWFWNVWSKFQDHRVTWKCRSQQLQSFHLAVAARDCSSEIDAVSDQGDEEIDEPLYSFDWQTNEADFSSLVKPFQGHLEFVSQHDHSFRQTAAGLLDWLIVQDESAVNSRVVSLLELFVGYRCFCRSGPLSLGSLGANQYQVVTFAVDFAYFKRVMKFLREQTLFVLSPFSVNLSHLMVIPPQQGVQIGWTQEIQETVFLALAEFIGQRPVTNHQSFARPWHI